MHGYMVENCTAFKNLLQFTIIYILPIFLFLS